MSAQPNGDKRNPTDYSAGLPDYHDPTAGFGGAPPAYSALTLRLVLAVFGLLVCAPGAVAIGTITGNIPVTAVLAVFAVIAAVDIGLIVRRKRRGEPG